MPSNRGESVSTTNACKVCAPLGACLAFKGIEGAMPYIHGSQGCATYIRRYLISHFREPMDIASSSFTEESTVFGGAGNLRSGLDNVTAKYRPGLIGVATSCLSETIGDDVPRLVRAWQAAGGEREEEGGEAFQRARCLRPIVVPVSTPSYAGTHADGFLAAARALVDALADERPPHEHRDKAGPLVNVVAGMLSPADLRYLKEVAADLGLDAILVPDYSDTLDGPALAEYEPIATGGTPVGRLRLMGCAALTVELGRTLRPSRTAGGLLEERFGVPRRGLGTPVGVAETDRLFAAFEEVTGRATPERHRLERGRLIDALVDGHKHVAGRRAVVYGDEDLAIGLTSFLAEIGVAVVLIASGGESGRLAEQVAEVAPALAEPPRIREGADFAEIADETRALAPDLIVGNSRGHAVARALGVPLVRVGFPVHDRLSGPRLLHVGYRGAQQLFDRITDALIERVQDGSLVGYTYM